MNKYERQPDTVIDLHGCTVKESERELRALLEKDFAHVRIIVGKGTHSKNGPVIRDFVKQFLFSRNIRFAQSKLRDGGEGALEVYF